MLKEFFKKKIRARERRQNNPTLYKMRADQFNDLWKKAENLWLRLSNLFFWGGDATAPQWAKASSFTRYLDYTQRRTAVGRTPLDE